jgi:NADH:ubiquinone oxidoreductase subunit 6 (subunit J)
MSELAFLVLSSITLAGAVGVVAARSVFVSAIWLVLSFFGIAGLYVTLGAAFLGVIQVLIYVGAISVLILFAVMLTPNLMEAPTQLNRQASFALATALVAFGILATLAFGTEWQVRAALVPPGGGVPLAAAGTAGEAAASGEDGGAAAGGTATAEATVPPPAEGPDPEELPYVAERRVGSGLEPVAVLPDPTMMLGMSFVTDQLLAFEIISVILLVALLGAIVIARE